MCTMTHAAWVAWFGKISSPGQGECVAGTPTRAPLTVILLLTTAVTSACTGGRSVGSAGLVSASTSVTAVSTAPREASVDPSLSRSFTALERKYGARLGVFVLDTGSERSIAYRADTRFAYASTYKALMAGVLFRRDTDAQLDQVVHYRASDLQDYAPITSRYVGIGMTVRALIAAAVQYSDNTAANLLFTQLGGPAGLQQALRAMGDSKTHVDRNEPALNQTHPEDMRDTTTPHALATDLQRFILGQELTPARRQMLATLMKGNTTGDPYIRAGVPRGWQVADKTGNADLGTRNDVAVLYPPSGSPIIIAVLSDRNSPDARSDDALIADATRATITALR